MISNRNLAHVGMAQCRNAALADKLSTKTRHAMHTVHNMHGHIIQQPSLHT